MIGRLRGILLEKNPPRLLLDVNGIAYEIEAPMFTFYRQPPIGQETVLHTHLVVREDAHLLYGFAQEQERTLFRHLIKVSAIGPKLALAILSGIEPHDFVELIMRNDSTSLIKIPGIGKKTAERLIIEMRDRLADWKLSKPMTGVDSSSQSTGVITDEAINALIALGYKPNEARQAINLIAKDHSSSEELIRHALRNMI
jgi:holliday junction DNA helicase RuvA